jgi:hypothetical protein
MFMVPIMFAMADYLVDDFISIFYPTSRDVLVKRIKELNADIRTSQAGSVPIITSGTMQRATTNSITDTL